MTSSLAGGGSQSYRIIGKGGAVMMEGVISIVVREATTHSRCTQDLA